MTVVRSAHSSWAWATAGAIAVCAYRYIDLNKRDQVGLYDWYN
jgi:hypothetical protein